MTKTIKYLFVSFLLIVVQTTLLRLLSLEGIVPDILTIWVVYIAIKEGQLTATLWGFGIGLLMDFLGGNFVGLSALTKTLSGFIAGYFYGDNKTKMILSSYRFPLIVFIVSLIQNTVYFIIFTRGSEIGIIRAITEIGLATTLYTATVTLLPMFISSRGGST